ncbi:hypothetical protein JOY44_08365 [Phormidium sp. CLA17]|uniref:hypothetical protein n=1 Tax=Leptolyngbya sp. Cla-17 TaxID=2803751 RepID=UPI0014921B35|nr:hypothetical protein [Leptolyngbya sp. Cla-17]MBM0741628.1 hypothetical protein [Leptolyngbya sp. Cla-17]
MIRIQKSAIPPEKLAQDGKRKRRSHCSSYSRNPAVYQLGERIFSFDSTIYAHKSVKQALIKAQHGKCCFCERLIGTDGDVEHFRPKQAYKQASGEPLQRPGYYWLAYEWDNLYLACPGCNQRHKQNLFPLQNPTDRAIDHRHSIDFEQFLFIDPGKEKPEKFIGFRGEIAYAIEGNLKGKVTIDSLKLNQRSLPEARLQRLQLLKSLWQIVQLASQKPMDKDLQKEAEKAADLLEKATKEDAEFSAASYWALQTNFQFIIG